MIGTGTADLRVRGSGEHLRVRKGSGPVRQRAHALPGIGCCGNRSQSSSRISSRGRFQDAITLRDVTATDPAGQRFSITGTMTIADKLASWEEPLVATDTTHFVVRVATGGVYGKVQVVAHVTANGGQHYLDFSDCEAP